MSHEVHHFSIGLWVLVLASLTAVGGCYIGLSCARRALDEPRHSGNWWLLMASLSIGGVGIWFMHFIGMLGFSVAGTVIRYNPVPTIASVFLAVLATLVGLRIADVRSTGMFRVSESVRLIVGGLLMGTAIGLMHYTGMAAIRIRGTLEQDPGYVLASLVIGIVVSTLALALIRPARTPARRVVAAVVMGSAVVTLHYTGMAGVSATVDPFADPPSGMTVMSLLFPAFVLGIIVMSVPIIALLASDCDPGAHDDRLVDREAAAVRHADQALPGSQV